MSWPCNMRCGDAKSRCSGPVLCECHAVPCAAMAFLIPIGVVFYAAVGGLKATFTTSYLHAAIVYIVLCM